MRLTRSQVARRLGKSVATVRRLEGRVLFPSRDWRGVHRFDDWEIEQLREQPERARHYARSEWFDAKRRDAEETSRVRPESAGQGRTSRAQRTREQQTNGQVLAAALDLLADRLSVVPTRALAKAGIDEALVELIIETLELVRDQN